MNPRPIQPYTRRFPLQIIKVLGLAIILLVLGSIAANPAQEPKMIVALSTNIAKADQGKCPAYEGAIQIFIDGVSYGSANTDRHGQDYRNFDLAQARPELCQAECAGDAKCKAYT
jgi:PAN domain-containing protein